jgi:hypothetical protein
MTQSGLKLRSHRVKTLSKLLDISQVAVRKDFLGVDVAVIPVFGGSLLTRRSWTLLR